MDGMNFMEAMIESIEERREAYMTHAEQVARMKDEG